VRFTPKDVAGLLQRWHAALESGEPLEAEARVRRADGEYRLLLHRKVSLRDERGAILKWYGSSIDIEEQRRAQERILQDERERLREALLAEAQRAASGFTGSPVYSRGGYDQPVRRRDEWSLQ
jgi:PAS fold